MGIDFFKEIKETKETFYSKMGTLKDRKSMDLREAEGKAKRKAIPV